MEVWPRGVRPRRLALDRLGAADLDLARLQSLWPLADEVDAQEAVLGHRLLDADVVGELEPALEEADRDAAIEDVGPILSADAISSTSLRTIAF